MTEITFDRAFEALTGNTPLRWQRRLFNRLYAGKIPQICDIPTGLGKTSVIPIWLIALSQQADEGNITLPRRLAYIINRRTVVDQATTVVEQIRERLLCPDGCDWTPHETALRSIASSLLTLASAPPLLGVSTLRGKLADNEEWKQDPARAAIIVGTIDMIGSKLLFSGYGDGQYHRAHHAGLIGQDTLIVHDEAHLTPAFSKLLWGVKKEQGKDCNPRPIHVMELSATPRTSGEDDNTIRLDTTDEEDSIVVERIDAIKRMRLHECDKKQLIQNIVDLAYCHNDSQVKVLIYVRIPRDAQSVESKLRRKLKADQRTALLTGTIRGYERDNLATDNCAYRQFLDQEDGSLGETVYLISTSAGEVGIDIDADHMVCDMTTLDSMIQRLGRVNRRGGAGRVAQVDVVWGDDENAKKDKAVAKTLEILRRWTHDNLYEDGKFNASPRNVRQLMEKLSNQDLKEAFSPNPASPPLLSDILLDAWSLTSVNKMPGRLEVAAYLHGLKDYDLPTTYVVWREELSCLSRYDVDKKTLYEWFRACPVRANERIPMPTGVLRVEFRKLIRAHRKNKTSQEHHRIVLLDERNQVEWSKLSELEYREADLEYKTVVLPTKAGGLGQHGVFNSSVLDPANDVADSNIEGVRRVRRLCESGVESPLVSESGFGDSWEERKRVHLTSHEDLELDEDSEGSSVELVLRMPEKELAIASPDYAKMRQTLAEHTDSIVRHTKGISGRLHLEPDITSALVSAARWHDRGKARKIWQRFARNDNGSEPLAKARSYLHGRTLSGYRHEFGSVLEAMNDSTLHKDPERDLILHLIAAHHGRARPNFGIRAFDKEKFRTSQNEQTNVEVMQRFGQLQQRFGRWGLAWLESLLRCADAQASQPEE